MRLAIFGGTGRVGRRLIEYADRDGHSLRALVRDPGKLPRGLNGNAVRGDVTDSAAVLDTLEGSDAVLSALGGAGLASPGSAISGGMRNIVAAMEQTGVRRVLAVAGSGVLDDPRGRLRHETPDFPAIFAPITREHLGAWDALRGSTLDWTLICCPDLLDGELTRRFRAMADVLPPGGTSISVEDVAEFMLQQVSSAQYTRRRVGMAY
jgi:putative NADH-flavin reductase